MSNRTWNLIGALLAGGAFAAAYAGEAPAPSSVTESSAQKKEAPPAKKAVDSKDLPNPKTPANVSESSDKSADADKKDRKK